MKIKRIHVVYFSPAGSTEKILHRMAETLKEQLAAEVCYHNYTLPEQRQSVLHFTGEELVLWGTPVYAGRIPNKTLEYVKSCFRGEGGPAIPVVVYGNRNYDQALSELTGIMREGNLLPFAAGAVVARHVFSRVLAEGRPDEEDFREIDAFAEAAAEELKQASSVQDLIQVAVPGPYPPTKYYTPLGEDGQPAKFLKALPVIDPEQCTGCGSCSGCCPVGSVRMEKASEEKNGKEGMALPVIAGICIKCCACVIGCPVGAISINDEAFLSHKRMLEKTFTEWKKSSFVLGEGAL